MVKISSILGLNARSMLYSYEYNTVKGRSVATSKLKTKMILGKNGIPVPDRYAKFSRPKQIVDFDWTSLPDSFALKPNKGLGGEGIIVVKKRAKDPENPKRLAKDVWITTSRHKVTAEDLKLHTMDILEGAFSVHNVPDIAYIEEYIGRHKTFRKYAYRGTPDIRVIVFNNVPIMAMLRLPTKDSGGRANLHQGAIAVGIDIATGITTKGYWKGEFHTKKPESKRKLNGIRIPKWTKILKIAVECQRVTGLGYLGVDVVLHPIEGPMVLELNYMPGLQIQMVNQAGLRKRLDRVEGLTVRDAEHGVNIAQAIFSASFADRVKADEGVKTVHVFEDIKVKDDNGKKVEVKAKLDTGAWRTSIDKNLASELGLLKEDNILWYKKVRSSLGVEKRPVINFTFWLSGRKIKTNANIADRSRLKKKVVVGRKALKGFLVTPELKQE